MTPEKQPAASRMNEGDDAPGAEDMAILVDDTSEPEPQAEPEPTDDKEPTDG